MNPDLEMGTDRTPCARKERALRNNYEVHTGRKKDMNLTWGWAVRSISAIN
jgi:hypothetical protein